MDFAYGEKNLETEVIDVEDISTINVFELGSRVGKLLYKKKNAPLAERARCAFISLLGNVPSLD